MLRKKMSRFGKCWKTIPLVRAAICKKLIQGCDAGDSALGCWEWHHCLVRLTTFLVVNLQRDADSRWGGVQDQQKGEWIVRQVNKERVEGLVGSTRETKMEKMRSGQWVMAGGKSGDAGQQRSSSRETKVKQVIMKRKELMTAGLRGAAEREEEELGKVTKMGEEKEEHAGPAMAKVSIKDIHLRAWKKKKLLVGKAEKIEMWGIESLKRPRTSMERNIMGICCTYDYFASWKIFQMRQKKCLTVCWTQNRIST